MSTRPQQGYLVLADISGYTSFMAGTELDHAHEIMSELLEVIVHAFCPALTLSKLEGDAVFVYAPASRISRGETVLELIEATYVAFRDHIANMHRRTTCTCAACRAIPTLDLKFMAHYGAFIMQSVAGNQEIVGSDVNLAHRLLKNHVSEETGWRAYALFTAACLEKMGVQPEGMHSGTEAYEHLGDVPTASINLSQRYKELVEARRVFLTPAEADLVATYDFGAPPATVWDWLNDPQKRGLWMTGTTWSAAGRPKGRTGPGASNHCAHGRGMTVEKMLDWRPFDYFTTQSEALSGPNMPMTMTTRLEPIPSGTRVHCYMRLETRMPEPVRRAMARMVLARLADWPRRWAQADRLIAEQVQLEFAPA